MEKDGIIDFSKDAGDLDLDIEEVIKRQLAALDQVNKDEDEEEEYELPEGFLPELHDQTESTQMEKQETDTSEKDQEISLENLESFEDLLQTLTLRDAELEKQKLELNEGLEELLMQSFESSLNSMESLESKSYHNSTPNLETDEKQGLPKSRRKSVTNPLYTQYITEEPEGLADTAAMKLESTSTESKLDQPQVDMGPLIMDKSYSEIEMEPTSTLDSNKRDSQLTDSKESEMEAAPPIESQPSLSQSSQSSSSSQLYEPFDMESIDDRKRRTSFMETETARKAISEKAKKSRASMIEKVQIARRASMIHVKELENVVEKQSEMLPDAVKAIASSSSNDSLQKENSQKDVYSTNSSQQDLHIQQEDSISQIIHLGPLIKPPKYSEAELQEFIDSVYVSPQNSNQNPQYSYAQIEEYVRAIRAYQKINPELFVGLDARDLFYKAQRLNISEPTNSQNTHVGTIAEVDESEFDNEQIANEMSQKMDQLDQITKSEKDLLDSLKKEVLAQKDNRKRSSLILKNKDKRYSLSENKAKSRRSSSKRAQSFTSGSDTETPAAALVPLSENAPLEPIQSQELNEEEVKKRLQNELMRVFKVYEDLREQIIRELETQTELKTQLDMSKNHKKALMHETRTLFALDMKLQEKLALLIQWLTEDAPGMMEREKDKSHLLTRAANSQIIKRKQEKAKLSRHSSHANEKIHTIKKSIEKDYRYMHELNAQMIQLEKENAEKVIYSNEFSNEVAQNRLQRMKLMEKQLAEEKVERDKELEDLREAIRRQKKDDEEEVELKDLEELNFDGMGMNRIPKILKETYRLKHLALDNNSIKIIEGLNFLSDLLSLNVSKNLMEQVDLTSIPSVKRFAASGNKLGRILGVTENLFMVDVSNNDTIHFKDFEPAKNLFVVIFKNSSVKDLSFIEHFTKVLYLDVYNSSVTELDLDYIFHCQFLLYLNMGANGFKQSPTIPSLMLRELDMSFNYFPTFRLDPWYPMLRILRLEDCKIKKLQPLSNCPFLQQIYLANNLISEFHEVVSLVICQDLEFIDLKFNPIEKDHRLDLFLRLNFKKLFPLDSKEEYDQLMLEYHKFNAKPLKALKFLSPIMRAFHETIIMDGSSGDKIQIYEDIQKAIYECERQLTRMMGTLKSPFLSYLLGPDLGESFVKKIESEERRLNGLMPVLRDILEKLEALPHMPYDAPFLVIIKQIRASMMDWSVIIAQSIWKRKIAQRRFILYKKSAITIQRGWRRYKSRLKARKDFVLKKQLLQLQNASALKIQKIFRGSQKRKIIIPKLKQELKERQELLNSNIRDSLHTRDSVKVERNLLPEDEGMDEWLKSVRDDEFDQELESYLSSESLIHYPKANLKTKFAKSKNPQGIRLITPSIGTRIIREREDLLNRLAHQLPNLEHDTLPPRNPYDPLQVLLLSRNKLQSAPIGQASFDIPNDMTRIISEMPVDSVVEDPIPLNENINKDPSQSNIEQEINTIKSLYNTLLESGILNSSPKELLKPKKHECEELNQVIQKKHQEYIALSETESINEQEQQQQHEECNIIYAWDAKNQSVSSRKKLLRIRKEAQIPKTSSVPIQSISLLSEAQIHVPSKPHIIPLVNNYVLQKMYGRTNNTKTVLNPNSKLPHIKRS